MRTAIDVSSPDTCASSAARRYDGTGRAGPDLGLMPAPRRSARGELGLADRLAGLADLDAEALRAEWRRLYRSDPPGKVGRDLLELGVAFRWQEQALGGLNAASRRRLAELATALEETGDLARPRASSLRSGARLVREWRGVSHEVLALEDGRFLWKGEVHRSLSLMARQITGTRWSGPRFFGLPPSTPKRSALAAGAARIAGPADAAASLRAEGAE